MLSLEQHVQPATVIGFKQIELFNHTGFHADLVGNELNKYRQQDPFIS